MNKTTIFFILMMTMFFARVSGQTVPHIIFDTDMGPDYDDVGALSVLHTLAARGECEILATVASNGHPTIAPTIEVINNYYHRSDIPIGSPSPHAPAFTAPNGWNDSLIHRYLPKVKTNTDYPSAVEVYRKILSTAEDSSVTIVTVGFTTNLADLLHSSSDQYSPLSGKELVRKKVKHYVAMAGAFPEGREFNVYTESISSYEVFQHWPTPILFSGFEIGVKIETGHNLAQASSEQSPVQWAYDFNLKTYGDRQVKNRASWDQTAVLCAVRDPERYFYVNGPGKFVIHKDGSNSWNPDFDAGHYFLTHKYPYKQIAGLIEEWMMVPAGEQ